MAGQSIRFDFVSAGGPELARQFKNTGDNAAAAARGAKVLQDVIKSLGEKEGRTAAESKTLAAALRQTGDAEDRVAAKALAADIAVRKLDDAMKDAAKKREAELKVKVDDSALGKLRKSVDGLSGKGPGALVSSAVLLAPAVATLGGVAAGAGAALGGAFIAGGLGLAAFGAVAKPVLADALKAQQKVNTAQNNYNVAIATGTKQAVAYKAEQKAIGKAYADLSPAQIALSRQLGTMAGAWQDLKAAQTPVVAGALQPWLKDITGLANKLGPVIAKISPVIASLGAQFGDLVNSPAFRGFRDFIGSTGAAAVSAGGSTIIDLVRSFMVLLPQFDPLIREAVGWIGRLGPAVLNWSRSKKASDDIQHFLQWFSKNGPAVGGFLKSIGGALKALAPGLASGGVAELNIMSAFFGFVARLPPGLAKPLGEVAGALLLLNKLGVVKVGVKLLGMDAAAAVAGGGAAGAWGKLLPGVRLAGGALVAVVAVDMILKNAPNKGDTGVKGQQGNWFETPFGMPGPKSPKSAGNWLTSFAPYERALGLVGKSVTTTLTLLGKSVATALGGVGRLAATAWNNIWANTVTGSVQDWKRLAVIWDAGRHDLARIWSVLTSDIVLSFDIAKEGIRITWDKIKLLFLGGVDFIMTTMGKLPGPLGAPFRAAHVSIQTSLNQIQGDVTTATGNIQADWDRIHGKTVQVNFVGSGSGSIAFKESIPGVTVGPQSQGILGFHAAGGRVGGHGGPRADNQLIAASSGEFVHQVAAVNKYGVPAMEAVNAGRAVIGYASGGMITGMGAADRIPAAGEPFMARAEAAFGQAAEGAFAKTVIAKFKKDAAAAMGGSGASILAYAEQFKGRSPYVWGGSTPAGWDCSGFVSYVLEHFRLLGGRMDAQGLQSWAKPSAPVPGGMAFYGRPAHHVGFVVNGSTLLSALGRQWGTIESALNMGDNSGYGIPPGGFGGGGPGGALSGSKLQELAYSMLQQRGWGVQWPAFNSLEVREAGWNMTATNPSSGAYGLAQFINGPGEYAQYGGNSTTAAGQLTAMMNYIGQRYGDPNAAWAHEIADNWYAAGTPSAAPGWAVVGERGPELVRMRGGEQVLPGVPGFASGGSVGAQAASYLHAWRTRHGGVPGAALGPVSVNLQIDQAARALATDATLARASLPAAQHARYAAAAAAWKHRHDQLLHERGVMQSWRTQLSGSDQAIGTWITAAGTSHSLAPSVRRWKAQRAAQAKEIGQVSWMLGLHAAQHAAGAAPPGPDAAQASREGPAFLKAWQARHGGGFGAAWGPVPVQPQIDAMTAALHRSTVLASARGLTAAQHRHWAAAAADERRRLGVLTHERDTERVWRNVLTSSGVTLQRDITAAGTIPSLRADAAAWKAQLAWQKWTIGRISSMLGLSAAQIAAAEKAGKLGPGGKPLPGITHTYGGDVTGTIAAVLAAAASPFTGVSMDAGGWLRPGWNPPMFNGTGRPEPVGAARGGGTVRLEISSGGSTEFDRFMTGWLRKHVKVRGGTGPGAADRAFAAH